MAAPATRAVRSDGIRSREAILRTAANLASVHGLEELSIGGLAAEVGMSKSGIYAHFGSKEELQLATIATATAIFEDAVLAPARRVPFGRDGLVALADAFCEHIRDGIFPGGCFFDTVAAELVAHPGPVREAVMDFLGGWQALIREHIQAAAEHGELAPGRGPRPAPVRRHRLPEPGPFDVPDRGRRAGDRPRGAGRSQPPGRRAGGSRRSPGRPRGSVRRR